MSKKKKKEDKGGIKQESAEQAPPPVLIETDEYGDPVIKGTYAGRDLSRMPSSFPGMQLEPTKKSAKDTPAVEVKESTRLSRRQAAGLVITLVSLLSLFSVWRLTVSLTTHSKVEEAKEAGTSEVTNLSNELKREQKVLNNLSVDQLVVSAMDQANDSDKSKARILSQRALAIAKSRDEGMKIISFGDRLVADGHLDMAEQFYRRAIGILGLSTGANSWEYKEALTRLANLCHRMQRFQEEAELNEYIRRLG